MTSSRPSTTDDRRTWEYETVEPPREATMQEATDPQSVLEAYGEAGWRLAATIDYVGGGTKFLVFERPPVDGVEDE